MAESIARGRIPSTPALRTLRGLGVPFEPRRYSYVERGGAKAAAEALGIDLHAVVKTLVFEKPDRRPFLVLMHGDREVSASAVARALGVKSVQPCEPAVAERHTGYRVGGTSPFGTRKALPVLVESSILDLPSVAVNGGARGLLVELEPGCLVAHLDASAVEVAR